MGVTANLCLDCYKIKTCENCNKDYYPQLDEILYTICIEDEELKLNPES